MADEKPREAHTIIAMAQNLGLDVMAEGVETKEQQLLLMDMGCPHFQGYLFSKPVPIDEFEALLQPLHANRDAVKSSE